ncbi:MAG: DUF4919 domain-containing protein [Bacteroidales bacterium]|nr:DUF4919 domain-containing protein [Bacteroidales bacterium]
MKATVTLFFLTIIFTITLCQENNFKKPDYTEIEKIISDKDSEYYYPEIFVRYKNSDTTLSLQDYRILYYGYLFNESYSAYGQSDYTNSLNLILRQDNLDHNDFKNIIRFEEHILDEFPFNLRDLNTLAYSYFQLGDTLAAFQTDYKLNMLIETILSTGDGKKEKTAWHVISVGDEYDLLGALGFQFGSSQSLTKKGCDYLEVTENDYGIKGFYFDVNMLFQSQKKLFK